MDANIQAEIDQNYRHNFIISIFDITTFQVGFNFIAPRTILPLFLSYLTDSTLAVGILSMIVSTGWLLPQLFTSNWVKRQPIKRDIPVKIGFFTERIPVFLLVPVAWMAKDRPELALVLFLVFTAWRMFGAGFVAVGWQDMIAKVFRVNKRGRFFGIGNFTGTAAGVLGTAVIAWLLDRYLFPTNFMIIFGAGAFFILLSWYFQSRIKEPAVQPEGEPESGRQYFKKLPNIIRQDHNFRRYLTSQIVMTLGGMAIGFFTIYAIKQWDVPDGQVGLYTTSLLVGQSLSNLLFGWMADRFGHKVVVELGALAGVLAAGIALIAPHPGYFYAVFALFGITSAAYILSGTMIVFEFGDEDERPTYIGLTNTILGIFSAIAPLIGGFLANSFGFKWMFAVALALSVIGTALLRFTVNEPRKKSDLVQPA